MLSIIDGSAYKARDQAAAYVTRFSQYIFLIGLIKLLVGFVFSSSISDISASIVYVLAAFVMHSMKSTIFAAFIALLAIAEMAVEIIKLLNEKIIELPYLDFGLSIIIFLFACLGFIAAKRFREFPDPKESKASKDSDEEEKIKSSKEMHNSEQVKR